MLNAKKNFIFRSVLFLSILFRLDAFAFVPSGEFLDLSGLCSGSECEDLTQSIASKIRSNVAIYIEGRYRGYEMTPSGYKAATVPVCDLGRSLDALRNHRDPSQSGDSAHPKIYTGGEGNSSGADRRKFPAMAYSGSGPKEEMNRLAACLSALGPENCFSKNEINQSCGNPCIWSRSDGVISSSPQSCKIENSWTKGLYLRIIWSMATAPVDDPFRIEGGAWPGVLSELRSQKKIRISRQTSDQSQPCQPILAHLSEAVSVYKAAREDMAAAGINDFDCQDSQVDRTPGLSADSVGNNISRDNVQARCLMGVARDSLVNSIAQLGSCEVFSRARFVFESWIGDQPDVVVEGALCAFNQSRCRHPLPGGPGVCEDCKRQRASDQLRLAAYFVTFRNWFIRAFLLDSSGRALLPTSREEPDPPLAMPVHRDGHS